MSRTIRRRNSYLRFNHIDRPEQVSSWSLRRYGATTAHEVIVRQKANFHADNHAGAWNAPSWYARHLNKKINRQNVQELHRCLMLDCWDDHIPQRHINNANWNWW